MTVMINDPLLARDYLNKRRNEGLDKYDEVWDGVTIAMPLPNNEHQQVASGIAGIIHFTFGFRTPPHVLAGTNVSNQVAGWTDNFRCPDVAVFLPETTAVNCDTHWCGGPDFLI